MQYSGGSNPGDPDCTSGLQTRVIFVCNKDAKWENEDITYYIEIEKETCFVSVRFYVIGVEILTMMSVPLSLPVSLPLSLHLFLPPPPPSLQYNIIAQYDGACYKAHDINGKSVEKTSYIGWIFIGM